MRYTFLSVFLLLTLLQSYGQKRPNVILITIDDLNRYIGVMDGLAYTPNIDALAKEGMLFTNAHATFPACNPSRASFLTGLRPETTGHFTNSGNFRDQPGNDKLVTLPQYFQSKGYEAVAAGKIFHKGRGGRPNEDPESDPQSWDMQWKGWTGTPGKEDFLNEDGYAKWHDGERTDYLGKFGFWGPIKQQTHQTGDWKLTKFGAEYLNEDHEKPFFLAIGIFRPHSPQIAPKEFFDLYPLEEVPMPEIPDNDMDDIPGIRKKNFSTDFVRLVKEKEQLQLAMQGYLASISYADACLGQLMDALRASQYADNTIVMLVSDHGFQLGHKDRWEKYALWNLATQVPMIVTYPGMKNKGEATNASVSLLDMFPTLVDLAGFKTPKHLQGNSLKPLLEDPESDWSHPAIVTFPEGNYAVKKDNWNYILYQNGAEELYDLSKDPNEYNNLARNKEFSSVMERLKQYLDEEELGL